MSFLHVRTWCAAAAVWLLSAAAAHATLPSLIDGALRGAHLGTTKVGICVLDVDHNQVLVEVNADDGMLPASNMKLVTTAAALGVLGPDFVFRTELRLAQPKGGPTTLIVRGDGDPSFGDPKILAEHHLDVEKLLGVWVKAVQNAGVHHVDQILVDDRIFDHQFVYPSWPADQLNRWYCAQVAGLDFYDNCLEIYPQPTHPGDSPQVTVWPDAPFVTTTNRAVTGDSDTFWVQRRHGTNELTFAGVLQHRPHEPIDVTVNDPPLFFGRLLADRLGRAGIKVAAVARPGDDQPLPASKVLHVVRSTLPMVIDRCNKDSQNLFAECLLKRIGHAVTGAPGSWRNGAAGERMFLRHKLGTQAAAIIIADGSGLSRDNSVTARALCRLLAAMIRDPKLGPVYRDSLSVGGTDGTLRKRFRHGVVGKVYGKSGYIDGVSTLSGYLIYTDAAKPDRVVHTIAFSLLFNDIKAPVTVFQIKDLQNTIIDLVDQDAARRLAPAATAKAGP